MFYSEFQKAISMKIFVTNKRCYFFFLFILAQFILPAQNTSEIDANVDYSYSKFKSEFQNEFGIIDLSKVDEPKSNIDKVFFKTELPDWLFNFPKATDSEIYAIGVSDPGMKQDTAKLLAILRAKAVCSFLVNSNVNGLADYYSSEKDLNSGVLNSSVYKEFNEFISFINIDDDNFNVLKEVYTKNQEYIVLVKLNIKEKPKNLSTSIKCLADISRYYTNRNSKYSSTVRMEIMIGEQESNSKENNYTDYIVKNINNSVKIISIFSYRNQVSSSNLMTYMSSDSVVENSEKKDVSCTLQHGLWHALFTVIFGSIEENILESDAEIYSFGMQHSEVKQNLNRVLSDKCVSFRLKQFYINHNTLFLKTRFITK